LTIRKKKMLNQILKATVTLAATLLAVATPLSAKVRDFPTAARPDLVDHFPAHTASFSGGVTGHPDVTYSTIAGYRPMVMDIYTPKNDGIAKPLILFIHGGGWIGGHTRHSGALSDFPKVLAQLASEGFIVASLEYRLSSEAPFPAQMQDARAGLRFLKANAGKYGIDASRVGVWGGSAGGHLAALTALSCGDTKVDPAPAPAGSECVQAAVTWYGVFDFVPMLARMAATGGAAAENNFLRCTPATCAAERVASVSPVAYIDAKDPPFLLIHGDEDKTVPVDQSHAAEAKMKAAGMHVESIYIPGVDHSFIGATPAITRAATLKATNATFDFFHAQLDRKKR
jgi:acetyl esterase/lipase